MRNLVIRWLFGNVIDKALKDIQKNNRDIVEVESIAEKRWHETATDQDIDNIAYRLNAIEKRLTAIESMHNIER